MLVDCAAGQEYRYPSKGIDALNTHGTGCSLSSAIAAYLAHALPLKEIVATTLQYLHGAIEIATEYRNRSRA